MIASVTGIYYISTLLVLKSRAFMKDLTSTLHMGNVWFSGISITLEALYEGVQVPLLCCYEYVWYGLIFSVWKNEPISQMRPVCRIYCDVFVGPLMILFYFLQIWYTFGTRVNISVSVGHWLCSFDSSTASHTQNKTGLIASICKFLYRLYPLFQGYRLRYWVRHSFCCVVVGTKPVVFSFSLPS